MKKWPTSGWIHAGIAFASALILSAVVAFLAYSSALENGIRTDPQYGTTGWNSLGAFAVGAMAAFCAFLIAFFLIFVIQGLFAAERDKDT